jgi:hypothetical protein
LLARLPQFRPKNSGILDDGKKFRLDLYLHSSIYRIFALGKGEAIISDMNIE